MTDKIVALSTCGSEDEARNVARRLLERRLAACVNIVPGVESHYHWQGKIESAPEWLLIIKTRRDRFEALKTELPALHSYTTPELIAVPVVDGLEGYLAWVGDSVTASSSSD